MSRRGWAGAIAAGWLLLMILACGSGGEDRREARNAALTELAPSFAPIRERLARAAVQLPAPGAIARSPVAPFNPPLRFDERGRPVNFAWIDVRHMIDPESRAPTGEFQWRVDGVDLLDCLRATAPNADNTDRSQLGSAEQAREKCQPQARLDYVVAIRAAHYERPVVNATATDFTAGVLDLEVFVIRLATGAIERQLTAAARSGIEIDFRSGRNDRSSRAENAADRDLETTAVEGVRRALTLPNLPAPRPGAAPPGWQQFTAAPVAYSVPPDWRSATTTTEFMLARWQRPTESGALPTFYVERRPNDRAATPQLGPEAAQALREAGMTDVQHRSVRDGAGYEWVEIESVRPPLEGQSAMHTWLRIAVTRDGQNTFWLNCGVPAALTAELAPTCQGILGSAVALE